MDILTALVRQPPPALPGPGGLKLYDPQVAYPWREGVPATSNWDTDRAIKYGYNASSWVYRCVTMTAELGMTLPLGEQVMNENGEWAFDWKSDLSRVLSWWNKDQGPMESKYRLFQYFDLSGNALVGKRYRTDLTGRLKNGQVVHELRVENPAHVEPFPDNAGGIGYYEYPGPNGERKRWEAVDICHGRLPDPMNPYWGMSRLVALARTIDTDRKAQEHQSRVLEKGGMPVGILFDPSITTKTGRRDAQKEIDETWQNRVGPFLAPADAKWAAMGMSPKDLDYLNGRTFSMREIVIAFGYHPALFGEDATFHNTGTAERSKWVGAVLPRAGMLCEMLSRGMIPASDVGRRRVWYDTSQVEALQGDEVKKLEMFVKLVASGVPLAVAAKRSGLDLPEWKDGLGDACLVDSNLVTLQSVVNSRTEDKL